MGSGSSKQRPPKVLQSFRPERSDTVLSQHAVSSSGHNTSAVPSVDITTEDVVQATSPMSDVTEEMTPEASDVNDELEVDTDFVKTVDARSSSSWPIFCLTKFPFNINAHYGGCTSIMLISCAFGGKGAETNAGATLIRSGFDCNHRQEKMFYNDKEGHFDVKLYYMEDEYGNYITKNLFGTNHIRLLTNDSRYGNLRSGIFAEIGEGSSETLLHVNVNGKWNGDHGAGLSMILCSSFDGNETMNAVYMVRSGFKDDHFRAKLVTGDDKFKFHLKDECLAVSGPSGSRFALFHNRDNLTSPGQHCFVAQLQSVSGEKPMAIVENVSQHASVIVLCSNSNGSEGCTVSSIYQVAVSNGKIKIFTELAGLHGNSYEKSDLWTFFINNGNLEVVGPTGPCKYGVMTNMPATKKELQESIKQSFCIATGETTKTVGNVTICDDDVTGEVNKMSDIIIQWNEKVHCRIPGKDLKKVNGLYKFTYTWSEAEKKVGVHLVKIFAVRKHTQSGLDIKLELDGSPRFLIYQKPGVVYALNTGYHAYKAVNDVVYASEFSPYANFDYSFHKGYSYKCFGELKVTTKLPGSISGTDDGFLFAMNRQSHGDGEDIQYLKYQIQDLPNGEYTFRLHTNNKVKDLELNGINVTQKININPKQVNYYTGHVCDIDITINNGKLDLVAYAKDRTFRHTERVCAFALLNKNGYKEKVETEEEKQEEFKEKQKIADTVTPPQLTVTRKSLTIVGWCPNLLKNPSGDNDDMKYWNTSSDFKVAAGGYNTEKCIVTSFNWCVKYQEIDLTEHFTTEYLDTAPDIQVLEWYKEGSIGGGFYCMTVGLLTDDGEVITEYTTGQIGSIYADQKWQEASHIFSDYGTGVRKVAFQSKGKDDKFWQGHFGTRMSGAEVRVKRQTESNPDDEFADIDLQKMTEDGKSMTEKIISNILSDNVELLQDFISENFKLKPKRDAHLDKTFEKQTEIELSDLGNIKPVARRRVDRKKREIRVFVSSTFRDFQKEREEIIKKAFREINRVCTNRGVFFTYVDLRWGITSEQTSDGKTIAICLQEIDRCRPYFICLMGERFGWSQRTGETDELLNTTYDFAIDNNPNLSWIKQYRFDTSVTQLEVMHGVLNAKPTDDMSHGFFYMREPYKEGELPESEYKRMISESEWHHERQEALKSRVRDRGDLNISRFKYPEDVAEKVKIDLLSVIDKDFPAGTELTKLELQREAHNAFAAIRVRVYIGRQEYFDIINENRSNQIKEPFVLMGESGCGKSALVANWAKRVSDAEPDTFMFLHFIGSSAESASYIKMIRRMYEEMKDYFGLDIPIPTSDQHLINDISKWLRVAGSRTKVVLVFDALNQLDDGAGQDGNEHDLLWIPQELPPNVFILLSTLPGRAMDACQDRSWPSLNVKPLDDSQKSQIITDYLEGIYAKTLTQEQKDMIVNAKQTSNALYLKSLLDEVRMYGSFRTLSAKIQEYLTAGSPGDLFAKILERLEDDFEKGVHARPNLVRDATTALWCSNRGMSENELVEFLNVPSAVWSPFYLSLFENLVNRDGILNFFHDHLRQAVELKYLKNDEEKKICYLRLADFFEEREMSQRKVEELPTLLLKAAEWTRLKATISDLDVFVRMESDEDGHFELVKAWRHLGDFSQVESAYKEKIDQISMDEMMKHSDYYVKLFSLLGNFYQTLGLMEAAKEIYFGLLTHLERYYAETDSTIVYCSYNHSWRYRCKHIDVIKTLKKLGSVFYQIGDYDKSIMYYEEAINRVTRQDGNDKQAQKLQLTGSLIGLATVYIEKGEVATARPMMTRALELAADIVGMTHPFYGAIFTKMGQLAYKQGQTDQALAFYMQNLKMVRSDVGTNHPRIANVLNEIALVYDDTNDKRAGELYEASLAIMLDTYGNNYIGTASIRYNLGAFYFGTNYFGKAKYQFNEAHRIFTSFLGDQHPDTVAAKKALDTVS